jgi:heat shock protein HtpX
MCTTGIRLVISRDREYLVDSDGAHLSSDPLALASALDKIQHAVRWMPLPADSPRASVAHMMIANPLAGHGMGVLFRTHPPTANRIQRLRQLAGHQPRW